jgi:hypothetical protein
MSEANSFNVSATFPSKPVKSEGMRTEKSPSLSVLRVANIRRLNPSPSFAVAPFRLTFGSFSCPVVRDFESLARFTGRDLGTLTFLMPRDFSSFAFLFALFIGGSFVELLKERRRI